MNLLKVLLYAFNLNISHFNDYSRNMHDKQDKNFTRQFESIHTCKTFGIEFTINNSCSLFSFKTTNVVAQTAGIRNKRTAAFMM